MLDATVSEIAAVSRGFRLLYNVRSRRKAISRQLEYCVGSEVKELREGFKERAENAMRNLDSMEVRLDNTSLIDHGNVEIEEVGCEFNRLGSVNDQFRFIFGWKIDNKKKAALEPVILNVLEEMKKESRAGRISEIRWRCIEEVEEKTEKGWFVVFNTLTVRQEDYEKVFKKGSTCFRDYVRDVRRYIGTEIFGSVREADRETKNGAIDSYLAVTERGSVHGRVHIHVLHCFRYLPAKWLRDPNLGSTCPSRREIYPLKRFWKYGFSTPIACRFNTFDAFGELGWQWPVEKKDGARGYTPIEAKPCAAVAAYLVKYLLKAYQSEKGKYQWRTKMSRSYGTGKLRLASSLVSTKQILDILQINHSWLKTNGKMIPNSLLRRSILQTLMLRLNEYERWQGTTSFLTMSIIQKSMRATRPRPSIVEQMRSSMKMTKTFSSESTIQSLIPILTETAAFDVMQIFERVFERKSERYPGKGGICHG